MTGGRKEGKNNEVALIVPSRISAHLSLKGMALFSGLVHTSVSLTNNGFPINYPLYRFLRSGVCIF